MDQSSFTPYAHGAAGHEGLSSDASGSMIIKPCTQAEIDFYESAKDHPEFQEFMPVYMGSLILNKGPTIQALATTLQDQPSGTIPVARITPSSDEATQPPPPKPNPGQAPDTTKPDPWIPSGGKKLTTGLAIVLENATAGFTKPNVLDLKIGARLWDDAAPESKRRKLDQVAAETTTGSLGFRVAGMRVWLNAADEDTPTPTTANEADRQVNTQVTQDYKSYDKFYGRTLTPSTVSEAFLAFFGGATPSPSTASKPTLRRPHALPLLRRLRSTLAAIHATVASQESRMYSASVLVVIEGDDAALDHALAVEHERASASTAATKHDGHENDENEDDDEDDEDANHPRTIEVRLIDFAHASWTPGQGRDENFLRGISEAKRVVGEIITLCS